MEIFWSHWVMKYSPYSVKSSKISSNNRTPFLYIWVCRILLWNKKYTKKFYWILQGVKFSWSNVLMTYHCLLLYFKRFFFSKSGFVLENYITLVVKIKLHIRYIFRLQFVYLYWFVIQTFSKKKNYWSPHLAKDVSIVLTNVNTNVT